LCTDSVYYCFIYWCNVTQRGSLAKKKILGTYFC